MCDDKDLDAFNAVRVGGKPSKVPADDAVFSQRLADIDDKTRIYSVPESAPPFRTVAVTRNGDAHTFVFNGIGYPSPSKHELSGGNYAEGRSGKPAEPSQEPDGRITIPITNGAPVRIDPAEWPVVARSAVGDRLDSGSCRGAAIILRRHADGRTVCEAAYVIDGEDDIIVGKVGDPSSENVKDFLAFQVNVISTYLNSAVGGKSPTIRRATENTLASLPAVEL